MQAQTLGWMLAAAWLGAVPVAARADALASAKASLQRGELKIAQIELRNAVRNDPQNAEAHYWLGRTSLELGDPIASEREAIAARDRGFDRHQAVALLSQALLAQNKFEDLLKTLKPDGKDAPLDAIVLIARGNAQIGLKHQDEAQKAFAQAAQIAPDSVGPLLAEVRLAMVRDDLSGARAKVDRALEMQPKSPEALLLHAQLLRLNNDMPNAITVLDGIIVDQPALIQARLDRASLELSLSRNDAARSDIDTVLHEMPGNVQALYLQAVMQVQARDYKAANVNLERISAYIGRVQRGYYLQAVVKQQLGAIEQAEDAARKYLARMPNDPAAYTLLARIQFDRQRPDQAVETLTTLAPAVPPDAAIFDLLGRAYAATGRGAEAIAAFQKAAAIAPDDTGVQTRLASVRLSMGDTDAAVADLQHTLERAPALPAVGEALFFAALATGDMTKAADALARIRAAEGKTAVVGNLEGMFTLAQLDFTGAKARFSEVCRDHPDFIPARINLARVDAMLGDAQGSETILTGLLAHAPAQEPALSMQVADYVQANRMQDAIALLERAHAKAPHLTRVTIALGDLYIRTGMAEKALDLVDTEPATDATSAAMLNLKAASFLAMGQKKDARDVYAAMLRTGGDSLGARRRLAGLLIEAGAFESARTVVRAGMAANPRTYLLYLDYAMIDLKASGIEAALATADRLQAQDRDFPAITALKGDLYLAAGRPADAATAYADAADASPSGLLATRLATALLRSGRAEEAALRLRAWLEGHPDDTAATRAAAEMAMITGHNSEAAGYLETLLKQKPHDPPALNDLAWIDQLQGNSAEAQQLARQAYVLSPGAQTADTLGWILIRSGNLQTGVALLRQARHEAGSDPRVLYHYAVALKDSGDWAEARKQLEAAVDSKAVFAERTAARQLLDDIAKGI